MLKRIGLSKSGYYRHKSKGLSKSKERQLKIKDLIMEIWEESQHLYGAPKITAKLRKMGIQISERTVGKYMKELKIRAKYCKPFTVTTRDSNLNNKLKNILDEQFNPEAPDTIWCIDTTYILTKEGFVYLTSIMDLFSRRIISWDLSTTLETTNIISLINKVKATRKSNPKIIHSDRGSQFTSKEYCEITAGITRSYSKKAYPWDNACIESFHAIIKRECLNEYNISSYNEARRLVFSYIDGFYNTVRIHSHYGYISPLEFEQTYFDKVQKVNKAA